MLVSALVGGWMASPSGIAALAEYDKARELFGETYGMQVFGIVFGFLSVARLNICYSRYWEGVTHIKMMHSKWSDACAQAVAFDRVKDHSCDLTKEPFCRHLIHLFSQLSAMATMSLHVNKAGLANANDVSLEWLQEKDTPAPESAPKRSNSGKGHSLRHIASTKTSRRKRAFELHNCFERASMG